MLWSDAYIWHVWLVLESWDKSINKYFCKFYLCYARQKFVFSYKLIINDLKLDFGLWA
jgi:hypothetical protein